MSTFQVFNVNETGDLNSPKVYHAVQTSLTLTPGVIDTSVNWMTFSTSNFRFVPVGFYIDNTAGIAPLILSSANSGFALTVAVGSLIAAPFPATPNDVWSLSGSGPVKIFWTDKEIQPFRYVGSADPQGAPVHIAGTETVTGQKTFTAPIYTSDLYLYTQGTINAPNGADGTAITSLPGNTVDLVPIANGLYTTALTVAWQAFPLQWSLRLEGSFESGTSIVWRFAQYSASTKTFPLSFTNGNVAINFNSSTLATAALHIAAGKAAAGGAPFKLTSGVSLTNPEDGAFEYDGTHLYFSIGTVRHTII